LRLPLTRHTDFFVAADKGGAVRIAELRRAIFYLRP
jgi:hypothetical protein